MLNQIIQGDCYELMKGIPDGSIDLVLTDPPYNTTAQEWDKQPIDLVELWVHIKNVLKPDGAVVLTGSQPFTSILVMSNLKAFKCAWVWDKALPSGHLNAKILPMKRHEDVLVFGKSKITYNPIMRKGTFREDTITSFSEVYGKQRPIKRSSNLYYPTSIVEFSNGNQAEKEHPNQKPIALFEYLIKTYSNPGETILDPFAGSGTTALAAHATGRNFICFEKESKYHEIANKRLALAQMQGRFEEMVG